MILNYLRQLNRLERRIVILLSAFNIIGRPLSVNEICILLSENYKKVWQALNKLIHKGIILKVERPNFRKTRGPKKAGRKPKYYAVYPLKDLIEAIRDRHFLSKYVSKLYAKIQYALKCESRDCLFNLNVNEIKEDVAIVYRSLLRVFIMLIGSNQYSIYNINIKIDEEKIEITFKNKIVFIYHYEITELRPRTETIENLVSVINTLQGF